LTKHTTRFLAVLGATALLVPAGAVAKSGNSGNGKGTENAPGLSDTKPGKGKAKGKTKPKNHVAKGTVTGVDAVAGTVVVKVAKGNKYARAWKGQDVAFNLSQGKVVVADVSGDGKADLGDVKPGDKVLVQAKLPRDKTGLTPPYAARKLIDLTSPPKSDDDEDDKPQS
jgi:hypothetical protein